MQKFQMFIFMILVCGAAFDGQDKVAAHESEYEIAFASFAPMNTDIFVADADGGNAEPLLANPESDYNASFSPDGKWIFFTSERNGSADIYRVHTDGKKIEQLTDNPAFDDQATLSPDGKSLAFVSSRSGQADICLLELSSKKLRNLTNNPAGDFRPAWSPEGKWIASARARGGFKDESVLRPTIPQPYSDIYVMRVDGSNVRMLTDNQFEEATPAWIPLRREKQNLK